MALENDVNTPLFPVNTSEEAVQPVQAVSEDDVVKGHGIFVVVVAKGHEVMSVVAVVGFGCVHGELVDVPNEHVGTDVAVGVAFRSLIRLSIDNRFATSAPIRLIRSRNHFFAAS